MIDRFSWKMYKISVTYILAKNCKTCFDYSAVYGILSVVISPLCLSSCWNRTCFISPFAETHRTVLSLISCFAGGVFLAACLLDIIPDYLSDISSELDARKVEVRRCTDWFGPTLSEETLTYIWAETVIVEDGLLAEMEYNLNYVFIIV